MLDVTHPDAAEHLVGVFADVARARASAFHKIDFIYGGAMVGRRHEDVDRDRGVPTRARARARGGRGRRGHPRLRRPAAAEHRPGGRHADQPGRHAAPGHPTWTTSASPACAAPSRRAAPARGCMAGSGSTTRTACSCGPRSSGRSPGRSTCETLRGLAVSSDPLPQLDEAHLARTRELMVPADLAPVGWDPWAGPDRGRSIVHPPLPLHPVASRLSGSERFVGYRKFGTASLARIVRFRQRILSNWVQSLSCGLSYPFDNGSVTACFECFNKPPQGG